MVAQSGTALLKIAPERWASLQPNARATLLRSELYRAFGWSFLFPEEANWPRVIELLSDLVSHADDLTTHTQTFSAIESLLSFSSTPRAKLQHEFDSIFGHTISAECPPYETQYGAGIIFAQAQRMGDITAFYRAFGVQVSDNAHERADHIAVELEFLSTLAFREATSIIEGQDEHAEAVQDAQRKFLTEHLGAWTLSFAERLERKAESSADRGFYGALATCLCAFVRDELAHAGIAVDSIGAIEPTRFDFEPEGCTFQCGAAGEPILANLPGFQV
jgi:DMSO reductase family type II enzyme chaperone